MDLSADGERDFGFSVALRMFCLSAGEEGERDRLFDLLRVSGLLPTGRSRERWRSIRFVLDPDKVSAREGVRDFFFFSLDEGDAISSLSILS
jgi:hypothetical protein